MILKPEILVKETIHSTQMDFLLLMQPRRKTQENEGLRLIARMKSQRKEMINMQTSKGFAQSKNMKS